jgi:uncharacterized repeat protein (TIGR03803 family)
MKIWMMAAAAFVLVGCSGQTDSAAQGNALRFVPEIRSLARGESSIETVLFSFTGTGGALPGANPTSGLTLISKSGAMYLYGAAPVGGKGNVGVIYDMHGTAQQYVAGTLWEFHGKDGASGYGIPLPDPNGDKIYETTETGGKNDHGSIVRLLFSNNKYTEHVIHSFSVTDGAEPYAGLTQGPSKVLFGTTLVGGNSNDGTIFELQPQGNGFTFTSLYSFAGRSTGQFPYAPVVGGFAGHLFGTTIEGGAQNKGTVYELIYKHAISEKVVHSFTGGLRDGAFPYAGLIVDKAGNLYGTATNGGSFNYGVVFELKRFKSHFREGVLHIFGRGGDGEYPYGPLLFGPNGVLYGTTEGGGAYGLGTVYKLTPSGGKYTETIVHSFAGPPNDGQNPESGLIKANGVLYGTTYGGGASNDGTIFSLTP